MAFRRVKDTSPLSSIKYNSPESKSFLDMYESNVYAALAEQEQRIPSKSFAPSSIRCARQQWFRLRGTKPDSVSCPDATLKFIADIGTHCHESVQRKLSSFLGDNWLDVETYLKFHAPAYKYTVRKNGYETQVRVEDPPVRFSCDGLIEFNDKVYLLEIKTSEAGAMKQLVGPKPEHLDQIMCYCTLMDVHDAMVLYQDRQYGECKCFTYHLSDRDKAKIVNTFEEVQSYVNRNIVPPALPVGDKWCNSSYCKYFKSCRKWGM